MAATAILHLAASAVLLSHIPVLARASPLPQIQGNGAPAIDSEGGASGQDGNAYSLSKGGLIAVIVVVVVVGLLGIASTVLFIVAKRRQWQIRETLKRASRRVASRISTSASRPGSRSASRAGGDKRGAVRMQSPPGSTTRLAGQTEKKARTTAVPKSEKRGGVQMTTLAPIGTSGLRNESRVSAAPPTERIEAEEGANAGEDGGKRWKAIMPPRWSIGGKASK